MCCLDKGADSLENLTFNLSSIVGRFSFFCAYIYIYIYIYIYMYVYMSNYSIVNLEYSSCLT